jgi:hypothetical protein
MIENEKQQRDNQLGSDGRDHAITRTRRESIVAYV